MATVVVTGASRGLGLEFVRQYAADGDRVIAACRHPESAVALKAVKGDVKPVALDVADAGSIHALSDVINEPIDILINNAVVRHFAPVEKFNPADWDRALAVNLSAAFHTVRLLLPGMRRRDFGRIVNISSIYGLRAAVDRVDYVTTKTALLGFTRAVALEVAAQNITCNAICPGSAPTPAIEKRFAEFMATQGLPREEAERVFMSSRQPSGRFVGMEGVAGLAAFLCGPDARDINGAQISVDGAWSVS